MKKIILFVFLTMMTLIVCGCKKYDITFVADGQVVQSFDYKKKADSVTEPPVPAKPGYTGVWSTYDLGSGDLTVNAVYTPITYTATFKADGVVIDTTTFNVETKTLNMPAVPEKVGYTGAWENYKIGPNNMDINAVYTVADYKVEFKVDNTVIQTEYYNINDKTISEPAVPEKAGYTGAWESYELTTGDKVVNAVYTPIGYTVTFKADGNVVETVPYDATNKNITEPTVPSKNGYDGVWETYELTTGNIVVNAVYTVIEYDVVFKADGNVVETLKYTVENKDITAPTVPNKPDYTGVWENYELTTGNIEVNVIYTPIPYNVIFKADGVEVATLTYTVENKDITEPAVPEKAGYTGAWESYTLTSGEIIVEAIYTHIPVDVTFVLNYEGAPTETRTTVDGYITYVPERPGYKFNGWWLSSGVTSDGYILSERFDTTQVVIQNDLVLYAEWVQLPSDDRQLDAPYVSIIDNVFTWNNVEGAQSYNIRVINPNNETIFEDANYTNNLWQLPIDSTAGRYIIYIYSNGDGYTTINSSTVTKYYNHNFLNGVYGLNYEDNLSLLTWDSVQHAEAYNVYLNYELVDTVTDTQFDLTGYSAGNYHVRIEAIKENWISSYSTLNIYKYHLLAPNVQFVFDQSNPAYVLSWNEVSYANEYIVVLNGQEIARTSSLNYRIAYNDTSINALEEFNVIVKAYDNTAEHFVSKDSNSLNIKKHYNLSLNIIEGLGTLYINGTQVNQLYVPGNEDVTILATPSQGYNFVNWQQNFEEVSNLAEYSFKMPLNEYSLDVNFNFYWILTIINDYAAGTITNYSHEKVSVGDTVLLQASPNEKYQFVGWFINDELISSELEFNYTMQAQNVTIYAEFVSYKVSTSKTYPNAGTISSYSGKIYDVGETVYLSATVNNGYTFEGWYLNGELYSTDLYISFTMPNEDVFAEARYEELEVTLNYVYNGRVVYTEPYVNSEPVSSFYQVELQENEVFFGWYASEKFDSSSVQVTSTLDLEVVEGNAYIYAGSYFGTAGFLLIYEEDADAYRVVGDQNAAYITNKLVVPGLFNNTTVYKASSIGSHAYKNGQKIVEVTFEYGIKVLAKNALSNCSLLEKVYLPDSLEEIQEYALCENPKLLTITIPNSVKTIGERAFVNNLSLCAIYFNNNPQLERIEPYAFAYCKAIKQLVLPSSIKYIGYSNFADELEEVYYQGTIDEWFNISLNSTGNPMYYAEKFYCYDEEDNYIFPTTITIPNTIKEVTNFALYGFEQIESVIVSEGVEKLGNELFRFCENLKSVQLPSTLIEIGYRAFANCNSLTTITIPANVETMGVGTFQECGSLETIIFEENSKVKKLPNEFLIKTSSVKNITIPKVDEFVDKFRYVNYDYSDIDNVYYQGTLEEWLQYTFTDENYNPLSSMANLYVYDGSDYVLVENLVIPTTMTTINPYSLYGCASIDTVEFHDGVTTVGDYAFAYTGMNELTIKSTLKSIGNYAFKNSGTLKSLTLDKYDTTYTNYITYLVNNSASIETLKIMTGTIPAGALAGLTNLKHLTMYAFAKSSSEEGGLFGSYFAKSVTDTTLYSTVRQTLTSNTATYTYYIPKTLTSVEVLSGNIGKNAFQNLTTLTDITIGESVITVGEYSFNGCKLIQNIYYNAKNATTSKYAFSFGGTKLINLYIGENVERLSNYFMYSQSTSNSYLAKITIPSNAKLTTIGESAFYYCDNLTTLELPDSVTTIGKNAFYGCSGLIEVELSDKLTIINEATFRYCSKLTNIVIPDSVTNIHTYAFGNCSALTKITLGNGLVSIGASAFENCTKLSEVQMHGTIADWCEIQFGSNSSTPMLYATSFKLQNNTGEYEEVTKVEIPTNVTSIGQYQFYGMENLQEVVLHDQITTINANAFSACSGLTAIKIPQSVTTIAGYVFNNCSSLTIYCEASTQPTNWDTKWNSTNCPVVWGVSELVFDNGYVFSINGTVAELISVPNTTNIIIPSSIEYNGTMYPVTTINDKAFVLATNAQAIQIPNTILNVNTTTFVNNTNAIFFATYLEKPESWADGWNNTSTVYWDFNENNYAYLDDSYYSLGEEEARLLRYAGTNTEYVFTSAIEVNGKTYNVTSIEKGAFKGNTLITKMTLDFVGESLTTNGFFAYIFGGTSYSNYSLVPTNIKEVNIVGECNIAERAFYYCRTISTISLSDKVTSIGQAAFYYCTSLTTFNIPAGVTTLNNEVFSNTGLREIFIPSQITSISSTAFYYTSNLTKITVDESNPIYDSRNNCNAIVETSTNKIIKGSKKTVYDETIVAIGDYAFSGCYSDAYTIITVPNTIQEIGVSAFAGANQISSLTVPFIGKNASGETDLTYILGQKPTLLQQVTITGNCVIPERAFYQYAKLKTLNIQGVVTQIGNYAFYGCTVLQTINLPSGLESIGSRAFEYCTNLQKIELPNTVTSLGIYAFSECEALKTITLSTGLTSISKYTFYKCASLTSIILPNNITIIDEYAFSNCKKLATITLPSELLSIEKCAFENCIALTTITLPSKLTTIGSQAFSSCTNLTKVFIPKSVENIIGFAFSGCTNLVLYCEIAEANIPTGWKKYWNSSVKEIKYNCTSI